MDVGAAIDQAAVVVAQQVAALVGRQMLGEIAPRLGEDRPHAVQEPVDLRARAEEDAAQDEAGRALGMAQAVGERERAAPRAAEQQPARDAEMGAQLLHVGDEVSRWCCPAGRRAASSGRSRAGRTPRSCRTAGRRSGDAPAPSRRPARHAGTPPARRRDCRSAPNRSCAARRRPACRWRRARSPETGRNEEGSRNAACDFPSLQVPQQRRLRASLANICLCGARAHKLRRALRRNSVFSHPCRSPGAAPPGRRLHAAARFPRPAPDCAGAIPCRATSRSWSGRPIASPELQAYGRPDRPATGEPLRGAGQLSLLRPRPARGANAHALQSGYVFVTRGLLALVDDEAELAAAMGHELGHITERHAALARAAAAADHGCGDRRGDEERLDHGRPLGGARWAAEAAQLFARAGARCRPRRRRLPHARRLSRRRHDHADREPAAPEPARGADAGPRDRRGPRAQRAVDPSRARTSGWPRWPPWRPPAQPGESGQAAYFAAIDGMSVDDPPEEGFVRGYSFVHPMHALRASRRRAISGWSTTTTACWASAPTAR